MPKIKILCPGDDKEKLLKLLDEAGLEVALDSGEDAVAELNGEDAALDAQDDREIDEASDDEVGNDEEVEAAPDVEPDREAEEIVCVIVLGGDFEASVETAVRQAAERGERVVGIWQQLQNSDEVPQVLDEYGSGCVLWDARTLRDVVRGEGESWQDPRGAVRAPVSTKRNRC